MSILSVLKLARFMLAAAILLTVGELLSGCAKECAPPLYKRGDILKHQTGATVIIRRSECNRYEFTEGRVYYWAIYPSGEIGHTYESELME